MHVEIWSDIACPWCYVGKRRFETALAMLVVTLAWDQLFLVYDILPATIPPALVLLGDEAWRRRPRALRRAEHREPLPST